MKSVDLNQLEEMYGSELLERIQKNIKSAIENNFPFKIEKVSGSKNFAEIAFVSRGYAYIYEVMLEDKTVVSKNWIGWQACENISRLMNSFN